MRKFNVASPNEAAASAELIDIIETLHRFSLVFALCASDAAAKDHIQKFIQRNPSVHISTVNLDYADGRIYDRLSKIYEQEKPVAIFVTGMEAWTDSDETASGNDFTLALNHARDFLHESVQCPVVLWVTPTVYNHMRRNAQDFFSIATATLRFSLPKSEAPSQSVSEPELPMVRLSNEQFERILRLFARVFNSSNREAVLFGSGVDTSFTQMLNYSGSNGTFIHNLIRVALSYNPQTLAKIIRSIRNYVSDDVSTDFADILARLEVGEVSHTPSPVREIVPNPTDQSLVIDKANLLDTATSLNNLAGLYDNMGRYADALPLYERALAISESALGASHPSTATSLNNLAGLYESMNRFSDALPLFERAIAINESVLGASHPSTVQSLTNLARLYEKMGTYDNALPLFERALAINESQLGVEHPATATSIVNLAGLYVRMGRYNEAKALYERVLVVYESMLGIEHPNTASALILLASLAYRNGDYSEAQALAEQSLKIFETVFGSSQTETINNYRLLSDIYKAQGKEDQAAEMLAKAQKNGSDAMERRKVQQAEVVPSTN